MPAPLYARYVPPKSTTKVKPAVPPILEPKQQRKATPDERPTSSNDKPKTKQKREIEQPYPVLEPHEIQLASKSKEKANIWPNIGKERSKKRKRDLKPYEEPEAEEATPMKHKSVLSKFEKSSKLTDVVRNSSKAVPEGENQDNVPGEELHDLTPLPQPAPVLEAPFKPTFESLPPWMANPITVESAHTVPFSKLGVEDSFVKKLEQQGYKDAFAVQTALLPMLHQGFEQHLGDICISAKTGSGKTLAYMLPIVEALKDRVATKLSAIIVVPTRQLVDQAQKVAEELCQGTKLRVGTAVGSIPFPTEQRALVQLSGKYDPERAKELQDRANEQLRTGFIERGGILDDLMTMLPGHVPHYVSGVDILICTPGRLVEHVESTTGFLLRDVRWLVIDEADQLLNQDFQEWATVLMDALHGKTPESLMSAQERLCQRRGWSVPRELTKVVLSATMKKDMAKFGSLRLTRPKLVVIEDETNEEQPLTGDGDVFELPSTLDEFAAPVGDGSDKPLYLLHLLQTKVFVDEEASSSSDGSSTSEDEDVETSDRPSSNSPSSGKKTLQHGQNRVLIFTKSNENASRLSYLLSTLHPALKEVTGTLLKTSTAKTGKKLLESFGRGKIRVLIASDRASRGLDVPHITHVVNYDIPHSVTDYVHRVGRTARAGKAGEAWTLFTKNEARWFWHDIARGNMIRRGAKKVERVNFGAEAVSGDKQKRYDAALQELQGAVEGGAGKAMQE
ncbi:P-loop containing nucleoside triphosphate hydrolase protein [Zopfia rhizophila CBS 207.26]|uniref:ATP-dependent RNA helicase n=1 Tax=Zopfia rhizophila CBS 207.26 TaxID=1314779 RepID=A0A6A6EUJ8_9PEZI|nr:P-loop containing nucleoside triphosphate hydrolase protein [Zopfia rhizophila CBS 207.26]